MNHNKNYIRETYPDLISDPYSDYGPGWAAHVNTITDELVERINKYNQENGTILKLDIQQIKQKFGGLRYYFTVRNIEKKDDEFYTELNEYVWYMEKICSFICERCGKYAQLRHDLGWRYTLCDEHYEEALEKKRKDDE